MHVCPFHRSLYNHSPHSKHSFRVIKMKLVLSTLESDSWGNVFLVWMPKWEAKARLEMLEAKNIIVTNKQEVLEYVANV